MKERKANLTKRTLDAAKPAAKDYQIWDTKVRGLGVRIYPSGARGFILQYRNAAGRTRKIALGRFGILTVDQARDRATRLLAEILDGRDPSQAKRENRNARTVGELADLYLREGSVEKPNKKLSSWETDRSNIERHIRPLLGTRPARGLTKLDVARFQSDIAAGKTAKDEKTGPRGRAIVRGGKGIASRALSVLSAMMTFGEGRGIVVGNPTKGVEAFRGRKTERFLTDTEVEILGDALVEMEGDGSLPWVASAAIKLLLLTGARRGEILALRWDEVDTERGCLRLQRLQDWSEGDPSRRLCAVPAFRAASVLSMGVSRNQGIGALCRSPKALGRRQSSGRRHCASSSAAGRAVSEGSAEFRRHPSPRLAPLFCELRGSIWRIPVPCRQGVRAQTEPYY